MAWERGMGSHTSIKNLVYMYTVILHCTDDPELEQCSSNPGLDPPLGLEIVCVLCKNKLSH